MAAESVKKVPVVWITRLAIMRAVRYLMCFSRGMQREYVSERIWSYGFNPRSFRLTPEDGQDRA